MGKAETLTLSLEFPEGQESPDTAGTTKTLRLKIFRASGRLLDAGESELQIPTDVIGKISTVFANTNFQLEKVGDRLIVKKREVPPIPAAGAQTADADKPDEPDYYAHFKNGEWADFGKTTSDAIELVSKLRTLRRKIWFDRNRRVFQYRNEERPLLVDGQPVDEKTLKKWMKGVDKRKRGIERRKREW